MKNQRTWQRLRNNPSLFQQYFVREQVLDGIRTFFKQRNFHDVETPLLSPSLIPESYLEVFQTTLLDRNKKKYKGFLIASPESFLKKLLVAGIGDCFSITKVFRNTDVFSPLHNPEFTMTEWYRLNCDYKTLMGDLEDLFIFILNKRSPSAGLTLTYQGKTIDLKKPWHRISMRQAFQKYAQIDLTQILEEKSMKKIASKKGYSYHDKTNWEELFNQLYLNEIEPKLPTDKPVFIYDYPLALASLSRKKQSDPRFAERFELYINGIELANCFSELSDWKEQKERFANEQKARKKSGKIPYPSDTDFIDALKAGLPLCAGGALGVDRMIMLFANAKTVQDTLFFPADEMWKKA